MVIEGLKLMFLGVGIVYFFLVILYFAITLMGKIIPQEEEIVQAPAAIPPVQQSNDSSVIAAISVAVAAYRKDRANGRI